MFSATARRSVLAVLFPVLFPNYEIIRSTQKKKHVEMACLTAEVYAFVWFPAVSVILE